MEACVLEEDLLRVLQRNALLHFVIAGLAHTSGERSLSGRWVTQGPEGGHNHRNMVRIEEFSWSISYRLQALVRRSLISIARLSTPFEPTTFRVLSWSKLQYLRIEFRSFTHCRSSQIRGLRDSNVYSGKFLELWPIFIEGYSLSQRYPLLQVAEQGSLQLTEVKSARFHVDRHH